MDDTDSALSGSKAVWTNIFFMVWTVFQMALRTGAETR